MKILIVLLLVLCACGDIGSSSSETNVNAGGGQGGDSNAIFDPVPTSCNISCNINSSGLITAIQDCEGGTITTYNPPSLDDCSSIFTAENNEA